MLDWEPAVAAGPLCSCRLLTPAATALTAAGGWAARVAAAAAVLRKTSVSGVSSPRKQWYPMCSCKATPKLTVVGY